MQEKKYDSVVIFTINSEDKKELVKLANSKRISLSALIRQTLITKLKKSNKDV